ncbi:MAG: hypothetical protein RL596_2319, partial [Bacteroidota bacterium]
AFVNLLALLGWNDGTEQEIFTIDELIEKFSMERVHKGGAKFDYEKAKWFNAEWIKRSTVEGLGHKVKATLTNDGILVDNEEKLAKVIALTKDRCTLLTDFVQQAGFFFKQPETIDIAAIQPKWDTAKNNFFSELATTYENTNTWEAVELESIFKELATTHQLKPGELMLPFRIMLVGGKYGPGVFDIAAILGHTETINRIHRVRALLQ